MTPLFATLQTWLGGRAATVVHLGAGSGAVLDAYAGLGCSRLVLAEGDPDLAGALSARAAGQPGVEVHAVALAADAGALLWNRYNLRAFNGPLDASALVALYPRLLALSTLPLQATGLADWLQRLDLAASPAPRVLVVDLPGQEHTLLGALPDALLWTFDAVLVRGCGRPPAPTWNTAAAVQPLLESRWFHLQPPSGEQDPLWPVRLAVQDGAGRERALAERAQAELAARLQALTQELDAARRERDEQAHWHQENARWAQGLKAEKEALENQLDVLRAELDTLRAQREAEVADRDERQRQHAAALEAANIALQARHQELEATRRERDEQAHWHQENARWAQGLKAEKQALEDQLGVLRAELDGERAQRAADRAASEAAAANQAVALAEVESARQALQQALDAARGERDEQAHWHQENAKWAQGLKAEKEALEQRLGEADAARQALQQELEATRRERDEQAHWHQENAKWAQGLKAEKETLERELAETRAARDGLAAQVAERDARQRLLDAEILRAEAQIDLIKDVLIREKNF